MHRVLVRFSRFASIGCVVLPLLVGVTGCGSSRVPDPRSAAVAYGRAAANGDANALYDMLSDKAKRELSREDVARMVQAQRSELAEQGTPFATKPVRTDAHAHLVFEGGDEASLSLEGGVYRVDATSELMGGAPTPSLALLQFRRALWRRSYIALLRVLTPETRAAVEAEVRALVLALARIGDLNIQIKGDSATVHLAGGHIVKLKRDGGTWHVDDFD